MTKPNQCLVSLARLNLSTPSRPIVQTTISRVLAPAVIAQQRRTAANKSNRAAPKKKELSKFFPADSLDKIPQFTLCDAVRVLRAYEVGQDPLSMKYDLAVRIKTLRRAPPVRNRLILPHPLASTRRIGVICKEGTPLAAQALEAGAIAAGQDSLFDMIREGTINFTAMICHTGSEDALRRATDLGRILGPKGLMPSVKNKTIVSDVVALVREMTQAELYREKMGVVRFPIGQLWFSPDMLGENIKAAMKRIKEDCSTLQNEQSVPKQIFEVVLSSTHGPGFSLNGHFKPSDPNLTPYALSGPM